MRLYFIALQFLTVVPLPFRPRCEEQDLGRSMAVFPLVGLTLGLLLLAADRLLSLLFAPGVTATLLVVLLTAVTGALHVDGVADVCDGLAARGSRERFLEVMKDPRCGAAGAAGAFLQLLVKYEAIVALPMEWRHRALLFFPAMARFAQVQATVGARRARKEGLGALFVGGARWPQLLAAAVTTLLAAWFLLEVRGIWIFILCYPAVLAIRAYFDRRLGGISGDIIGFTSEVTESLTLLLVVAFYGGRI